MCSEKPLLTPLYRVTVSPFSVLGSHHPYSVASVTCLYICPLCWAIPQEEKLSLFLLSLALGTMPGVQELKHLLST